MSMEEYKAFSVGFKEKIEGTAKHSRLCFMAEAIGLHGAIKIATAELEKTAGENAKLYEPDEDEMHDLGHWRKRRPCDAWNTGKAHPEKTCCEICAWKTICEERG